MRLRSIALFALALAVVVGCKSESGVDEGRTATVSVTIGLSASEVGAATVEFFVSHPTALPQPLTGTGGRPGDQLHAHPTPGRCVG